MLTLHCFSQSGNAFKVAFLLNALDARWQPKFVDFMNGATRAPEWRGDLNEMGEVPVLDDGDLRLTQSGVILLHLAEKYGKFGGKNENEKREILRWMFFDNHKFTGYLATYRFMRAFSPVAPDPAVMKFMLGRVTAAYKIVEKHLQSRDWLVGDAPTIADFSLCGYTFFPTEESGIDLAAEYPNIYAWTQRLKALPGWKDPYEMMPGERIAAKWV